MRELSFVEAQAVSGSMSMNCFGSDTIEKVKTNVFKDSVNIATLTSIVLGAVVYAQANWFQLNTLTTVAATAGIGAVVWAPVALYVTWNSGSWKMLRD
jgi:hypothetical protein